MGGSNPRFRFSIYRSDIHAGKSGYVAEQRYHTIAEALAHPYHRDEDYLILLHDSRRWMGRDEFEAWASLQER